MEIIRLAKLSVDKLEQSSTYKVLVFYWRIDQRVVSTTTAENDQVHQANCRYFLVPKS